MVTHLCGAEHVPTLLAEQSVKVERPRVHRKLSVRVDRPCLPRPVPVEFDAIAVGVAKVDCFAYTVIASAVELDACRYDSPQGIGKFGFGRVENRQVVQACTTARRRRSTGAFPRIQADMVMVSPGADECRLRSESLRQLKSQHSRIERECAVEVGYFQVNVSDADIRMYRRAAGDHTPL
jgi:hypothetical protein